MPHSTFQEVFLSSSQLEIIFASFVTGTLCLRLLLDLGHSYHTVVCDGEYWQLDGI